jgi:hypothetical protein
MLSNSPSVIIKEILVNRSSPLRFELSYDIAEILLKVALNTKKAILYVKQPTTNIFEDYTHLINLNPSNCI